MAISYELINEKIATAKRLRNEKLPHPKLSHFCHSKSREEGVVYATFNVYFQTFDFTKISYHGKVSQFFCQIIF